MEAFMGFFRWVLIYVYTFLFVYGTLVLPFNVIHVLFLIASFFLVFKYNKEFFAVAFSTRFLLFYLLSLVTFIYALFMHVYQDGEFAFAYNIFLMSVEISVCAIFIVSTLYHMGYSRFLFFKFLVFLGLGQSLAVLIQIAFPELREFFIAASGSAMMSDVYDVVSAFRMFGIATGYNFAMPLFQGLCVVLAFVLARQVSKAYYLALPFLFVSIALNARIGLIAFFIAPLVYFGLSFVKRPSREIAFLTISCLSVFLCYQVLDFLFRDHEYVGETFKWLESGLEEIVSFATEKEATGNLEVLITNMWFFPEGWELLFGTGEYVFGKSRGSDIGYVIDVYFGGMIYAVILYVSYLMLFRGISRFDFLYKVVAFSILIMLVVSNFKGNVFTPNEFTKGVMLIVAYISLLNGMPKAGSDRYPMAVRQYVS